MKRIRQTLIALLSSTILLTATPIPNITFDTTITAEAHSGRTDSRGGHRDNKNKSGLGSYHYHCGGHPAHLHPNGVCPYSGTPASSSSSSSSSSTASSSGSQNSVSGQAAYSNYETYLLNKYAYAINEYAAKAGTYPTEVGQSVSAYLKMDGITDEFLAAVLLTPGERADLYPIQNSVQAGIFAKIASIRLLDAFNAQYEAQQAQLQAQQQAQLQAQQAQLQAQQNQVTQDAFLYSLVTQLQTQLTALGFYTGIIDGVFDVETQQALINFQTAYGLTVDGTINQEVVTILGIAV